MGGVFGSRFFTGGRKTRLRLSARDTIWIHKMGMLWYSKGSILFYFAVNCGKKGVFKDAFQTQAAPCGPRGAFCSGCGAAGRAGNRHVAAVAPCHAPGYAQCGGAPGHAAGTAALVELSNICGRALLRRAGGSEYAVRRRGGLCPGPWAERAVSGRCGRRIVQHRFPRPRL